MVHATHVLWFGDDSKGKRPGLNFSKNIDQKRSWNVCKNIRYQGLANSAKKTETKNFSAGAYSMACKAGKAHLKLHNKNK